MKNLKFILTTVLGIVLITSCSSDDEGSTNPNEFIEVDFNENYLEGDRWYYLDVLDQDGNSVKNTALQDCDLDNYFLFDDINKTYEINAFTLRCEGEQDLIDGVLDSGTYIYSSSDSTITFNNGETSSVISNVKIFRDQNGFGNIKLQFTNDEDNYIYEIRKGVF